MAKPASIETDEDHPGMAGYDLKSCINIGKHVGFFT